MADKVFARLFLQSRLLQLACYVSRETVNRPIRRYIEISMKLR